MDSLSQTLIDEASDYLRDKIRVTPIEYSPALSEYLGGDAYLKLEHLQITGSFKIRGAFYRLSKLSDAEKRNGVITCSAGNHGKAVSYVGNVLKIPVIVYVPSNVDQSKYEGMRNLGAEVIKSPFVGYDDTEIMAREIAIKAGKLFIPAFDDIYVMAGNGGSLGMEIMEQLSCTKLIAVPVSGGGLCSGLTYYVKEQYPDTQVYGCQLKDSPGLALSLQSGKAVSHLPSVDTIAGGLEGGLGQKCYDAVKHRIDGCALVEEHEIYEGFRWCLKHHQYLVEPSGVAVIAAALNGQLKVNRFPAVFVLTGRNVGITTISRMFN